MDIKKTSSQSKFSSMGGSILFYWYLKKSRFAQAQACLDGLHHLQSGWQLWCAYRLDMYSTVAKSRWNRRHIYGGVAYAVSLAACAKQHAATIVVNRLLQLPSFKKSARIVLADALAPYMPELALRLLSFATDKRVGLKTNGASDQSLNTFNLNSKVPPVLYLGLLMRTGNLQSAQNILKQLTQPSTSTFKSKTVDGKGRNFPHPLENRIFSAYPELLLLSNNILQDTPSQQLDRLNRYWEQQSIPPAALINNRNPLSTKNLKLAHSIENFNGPLISVLMTAFNVQDTISSAIQSLQNQTYSNIEIIVIDDASTDCTVDVVNALASQDQRIKLIRLPKNVGTFMAKNIGFLQAKGEFVTCHDSDDWSHPLRLENQAKPLLENKNLVATTSHWARLQDDGDFYARPIHPLTRLNPASPLFRKDIVARKMGLWDCVRTGADSEFHARLKLVFGRKAVKQIKQLLCLGAHRADSLMNAESTGYDKNGTSPKRLAYWESWTHWHIAELKLGKLPVMPSVFEGQRTLSYPFIIDKSNEIVVRMLRKPLKKRTMFVNTRSHAVAS